MKAFSSMRASYNGLCEAAICCFFLQSATYPQHLGEFTEVDSPLFLLSKVKLYKITVEVEWNKFVQLGVLESTSKFI